MPKCSAHIAAVIQLKLCGDRGASNFCSKHNLFVWVYTSVFECCTSRPWCADAFHLNSWNLMNLCSHCTPLGAVLSQSLYGKAFSSQPARAFWSQKVSGTATRNCALMGLCLVPFCPSSFFLCLGHSMRFPLWLSVTLMIFNVVVFALSAHPVWRHHQKEVASRSCSIETLESRNDHLF